MRHISVLLAIAVLAAACSPAPSEETAASGASEAVRSSIIIPATASSASSLSAFSGLSGDGTCLSEIGKAASNQLVERCLRVSPATHPPCNAANSCQMIRDEIDRSCAMYGAGETKPKDCTA